VWAGATPETLINIDKQNQLQTVALAATQAFDGSKYLEETTWSQKDIEEQAMVSRYIINCFKKIRLREFEEIGPRTHLSGNIVHLKTNYKVDMEQVAFPELGSVMLDLLHPTSAVCGMPKEITQTFIEQNEGFDREYFSGYLGPVNVLGETNIFVNLRCAKLESSHAVLYAGAGIIANSIPEKEWKETEIKMETMLSVIEGL
jgi:isochorismate synthase